MVKLFQILAVICIGIAAFFLWRTDYEAVFIAAVLGAICFFLSVRFEVGERVKEREAEKKRKIEEEKDSHI
ncbi:MAG TPA: hypothetical protein PKE69_13870 [Pyrinomonadaceae bacterium]|nr:hypothetical protein [Pyrinomonadaceae bacterium]